MIGTGSEAGRKEMRLHRMLRDPYGGRGRARRYAVVVIVGLLTTLMATLLGINPVPVTHAASAADATCTTTTVNTVAHEDDDLLFMNPDIMHDIAAGDCVHTVFFTAGDAGKGSSYWLTREAGSQAAYAKMAGVADTWTQTSLTINGHTITEFVLAARPSITLINLRLPDANGTNGSALYGYETLQKVWLNQIPSITADDQSNTYTRSDLIATTLGILNYFQPRIVRTQDYLDGYGDSDHVDHHTVAYITQAASQQYALPHTLVGYYDYQIQWMPQDVFGTDLTNKVAVYNTYVQYDSQAYPGSPTGSTSHAEYVHGNESGGTSNQPPVAYPGETMNVSGGATVQLDGTGSSDPNGKTLTYAWTQTYGPSVTLSNASSAKPTFVAPVAGGTLMFNLVVNNGTTSSLPYPLTIVVAASTNAPPTANAGANQTVASGATVTLDGSGSSDPNGKTLTYAWTQTAGSTVTLSSTTAAKPTFTAPTGPATLTFQLVVNNGTSNSTAASVTITVNAPVSPAPTANAGTNQTVASGASVTLDGSGSSDPNGKALTYAWTQTAGSSVTLSSASAVKPTFTAPSASATLTFQLIVNNGTTSSSPASVTITVNAPSTTESNLALQATATASSQTTNTGQTAAKAIDGVAQGYPADYTHEWATNGGKAGSWLKLTWASPVTLDKVVLYDRPNQWDQVTAGTLTFSDGSTVSVGTLPNDGSPLTITFPATTTTTLLFTITAVSGTTSNVGLAEIEAWGIWASGGSTGNSAPTANAGANQTVASGASVTLDGSASSDPNGKTLTYAWTQTAGSSVTLSSTTAAKPTFTAPSASATLTFQLVVNNGMSNSTAASVTITVNAPVSTAPTANAGTNQTVNSGATVTLDGSGSSDPNGKTLTYAWTQTAGSTVTLSSASAVKPTFTAPTGPATLTFQLVVNNGTTSSSPASVTITVNAPSTTESNLALQATATASSQTTNTGQTAAKAIDGVAQGYPADYTHEWATNGGKAGSWLKLTWASPVTLDKVVLYDRPNQWDQVTAGTLTFSDGSTVSVGTLPNDGSPLTITFPATTTTTLLFTITAVSSTTSNVGLAEIEAWGVFASSTTTTSATSPTALVVNATAPSSPVDVKH